MDIFSDMPLRSTLNMPLYQQLYTHLREAILAGHLKRGTKLPSTRTLAIELNISRNTILNAYEQLLAEGYLESVESSGTFVASVLPDVLPAIPTSSLAENPIKQRDAAHLRLSKTGETLRVAPGMPAPPLGKIYQQQAFRAGIPALDAFPFDLWGKLVARNVRHATPNSLMYQEADRKSVV